MGTTGDGKTKRIEEISMLKGLGMLYVITAHMACISGAIGLSESVMKLLTTLNIAVMVQFYMISGYTSRRKKGGALYVIRKRAIRIFIPYYIYSLIMIAVLAIVYLCIEGRSFAWFADGTLGILFQLQSFHHFDMSSTWMHPMFYSALPGWFQFQLFVSELLFIPLLYLIKKNRKILKITLAFIFLLVGALLYLMNLQGLNGQYFPTVCKIFIIPNIPGIAALLLIGNFMADHVMLDFDRYTARAKAVIAAVCFVITMIFAYTDDYIYDFPIGKWGAFGAYGYILAPLYGISVMMLFGVIANLIKRLEPVKKALILVGDNSMDYLMLHFFVGFLAAYIGRFWYNYLDNSVPTDNPGINILHFAILLVSSIAIPAIAIMLKKRLLKIIAGGDRNG